MARALLDIVVSIVLGVLVTGAVMPILVTGVLPRERDYTGLSVVLLALFVLGIWLVVTRRRRRERDVH